MAYLRIRNKLFFFRKPEIELHPTDRQAAHLAEREM